MPARGSWASGWPAPSRTSKAGRSPRTISATIFGHDLDWYRIVEKPFSVWLAAANGGEMQAETPLTWDDLVFLREGPSDPLDLAWAIIERKQPRWLMGWRDITNATNERTVIASVFPKVGVGNNLPVWYVGQPISAPEAAAFVGADVELGS